MKFFREYIWEIGGFVYGLLFFLTLFFVTDMERKKPFKPEIVLIDSCEYIRVRGGIFKPEQFIHKANCKNH